MPRPSDRLRTAPNFTTGEVAELCGVTSKTVTMWFKSGKLQGFRIPGRHIRISRASLIEFMKQYGMPLGVLESARSP